MVTEFHIRKALLYTKFVLVLLLVGFVRQVVACPKDKPWKRLSRPEKVWTIFHPVKAKKVYRCALRSRVVTDSLQAAGELSGFNGGQLDAFRHAYWTALMIEAGMKESVVARVGEKHEKGNYIDFRKGKTEDSARADSMACVMDLKNNAAGIAIGKDYVDGDKKLSLIQLVLIQLWNGKLFILHQDAEGNYLDCSGHVIVLKEYAGKWNIPKCLVNSDMISVSH